jgi:NAD(P)-dependent dehydrogenase (short-subunit alcohol dehydrogenase family)
MRPMADQTILITGATDGLGKALAAELAATGARLLHGRDDGRGADTIREIQHRTANAQLRWYRADLSSLRQTADLAQRVADDCGRLDTLVNNAGIGFTNPGDGRRVESQDGHELRFAVNYLAPYLLTRKLQPVLLRSAPARVVNVASAGQEPIDFTDVMLERDYHGVRAYRRSKLALVMFTFDLAAELARSGVTVNCLHPATFMPTKMVVGYTKPRSSVADGLRATMRLIVSPALENVTGRYYDGLQEATASAPAYDQDARQLLQKLSDQLTGPFSSNEEPPSCPP